MYTSYLKGIIKQFIYYKSLGDKTFEQLNADEIHLKHNEYSNNITIVVKHIVGNMLSRWTNFLNEDGEKEWRHRDSEFEDTYKTKEEMILAWEKGWQCLFDAITPLKTEDLERIIYIRNQGQTVVDAINRQLAHYAYHIGQIVFIGTLIKDTDWKNLSVPKNKSAIYNQKKFSKEKHRGHFTDDL
jgi:predicted SprT family Zn-dependent metalloprotease